MKVGQLYGEFNGKNVSNFCFPLLKLILDSNQIAALFDAANRVFVEAETFFRNIIFLT